MIHYYINPKTRALIMLDPEAEEIFVVERIEKVRVMTGSDIRLGDFEGSNGGAEPDEHYSNHNYDAAMRAKGIKVPHARPWLAKPKLAPAQFSVPKTAPKRQAMTDEQKAEIVRRSAFGEKPKSIADAIGVKLSVIYQFQHRMRHAPITRETAITV
jgi:hypothetical protein